MPDVKVHPEGGKGKLTKKFTERQKRVGGAMAVMLINSINPRLKNYSKPLHAALTITFLTGLATLGVFGTSLAYYEYSRCVESVRFVQNFGDSPSQWRFAFNTKCENSPNEAVSKGCESEICITDMKKVYQWEHSTMGTVPFQGQDVQCPDPTDLEYFPHRSMEGYPLGTKSCTPDARLLAGEAPDSFMSRPYDGPPGFPMEVCQQEGLVSSELQQAVEEQKAEAENRIADIEAGIADGTYMVADANWICPELRCFGGCYFMGQCIQGNSEYPMTQDHCDMIGQAAAEKF
jgi:hypothetical protein